MILALAGVLTVFFLILVVFPPSLVRALEYLGYDEMVKFLAAPVSIPDVAVVDVDETSLAKLGQWPWPRYRVAALIKKASELGARTIVMDFFFSEPDRLSLTRVRELYGQEREVTLNLLDVPAEALDNDRILAEMVARHKVVLAADLQFGETGAEAPVGCGNPFNVVVQALPGTEGPPPVPTGWGMVCPLPELADAATLVAATNMLPDIDGKVRRIPLILRCGERWVPSLALAGILTSLGENHLVMKWSPAGILELRLGNIVIVTDYQGNMLLPYRKRPVDRFRHVSAVDLLDGRVDPESLNGKTVFIGSSASGLQDRHATPVMKSCPGIDLHALAADAMLRGDFFVEAAWNRGLQALIVILAGVMVGVLVAWTPITFSAFVTGGAAVALLYGSWTLLSRWGVLWSPVPGTGALLVNFAFLTLVRLRREENRIHEQLRRLSIAQNCALLGLVSVAETRDPETGRHIIRTQHFVKLLAEHLSKHPKFHRQLTREDIDTMFRSAPLHDVGKVGVPDNILLKPGPLTDEEYALLKLHTVRGFEVLKHSEEMAGVTDDMSFLHYAKEVARSHHEKWDGTGYPDGLKGEDIPLTARLMALADVYDALRAKRVYKPRMTHEKAKQIICDGKGTHFDPDVVDAFISLENAFQQVLETYADPE